MVEAVLFDFSGTLVDCGPAWWDLEIYSTVRTPLTCLRQRGDLSVSDADLARADELYAAMHRAAKESGIEISAHEAARQAVAELQLDVAPSVLDAAVDECFSACVADAVAAPGALATLQALQQRGLTLGVISNARHGAYIPWALERLGLLPFFSAVVVSADVRLRKPRPEIYWQALAGLGIPPAEAAFVGDYYAHDMAGARAAGLRSIWLIPPGKAHDDLPVDHIIASLPDLIPYVDADRRP
jgi:HAD superfamily hydrolase (TIGR01509 family)